MKKRKLPDEKDTFFQSTTIDNNSISFQKPFPRILGFTITKTNLNSSGFSLGILIIKNPTGSSSLIAVNEILLITELICSFVKGNLPKTPAVHL